MPPKPVSALEYRVAKELHKRRADSMWSYGESPESSFDSPEYKKLKFELDFTDSLVRQYETDNRKVDDAGKVQSVSKPMQTKPMGPPPPPSADMKPSQAGFNYFFEPSIAEVQKMYRDDPDLAKRLGVDPGWLYGVAEAAREEDVLEPSMGVKMGTNTIPAKTHLDNLKETDEAYTSLANHLWQTTGSDAALNGINVQRYRDIPLRGQTPDFLAGGAIYNIERRLTPAVLGATDSMTFGMASPAGDYLTEKIDEGLKGLGVEEGAEVFGPQPTAEEVRNRSPGSYLAGSLYGYGLPRNPTNALQQGAYNQGIKAMGYGERVPGQIRMPPAGAQVGASVVAGGLANTAEGAARDFTTELQRSGDVSAAAKSAVTEMPFNQAMGMAGGVVGEALGQVAGKGRELIRSQDNLRAPLKALREAGGETSITRGVVPTTEIRDVTQESLVDGSVGSPAAIAAERVAPQIQESLERQNFEAGDKIGKQMEAYYGHPDYRNIAVSSKPLIKAVVEMAKGGQSIAPVSGSVTHMDQNVMRAIRNELNSAKWAEPRYTTPEQAQLIADEVDGVVTDAETAFSIFGPPKRPVGRGSVAVIVPLQMNARQLITFEDKVYDQLKPGPDGARIPSPVYIKLDEAAKQVRDQFPYWEDEAGNLVAPPGGGQPSSAAPSTPQGPSSPQGPPAPPPESAPSTHALRDSEVDFGPPSTAIDISESQYDEVAPSQPPSTRQELSGSEVQIQPETEGVPLRYLAGHDITSSKYIPAEEVRSEDFLAKDGVELGSSDFEPPTPKTPNLRDLRRRKTGKEAPEGPQKGDYEKHNDYLLARADWRLRQGQATDADVKRLAKHTDAMPSTERLPSDPAPQTQRSPTEDDATPLSLLAGNKLAMEVPEGSVREPTERVARPQKSDEEQVEEVLSPGRVQRSGEAQRMNDLLNQREAYEQANAGIGKVEERLGNWDPDDRFKEILRQVSEKMGREVTKEDLIRAGIITGSMAAMFSDDENVQRVGAMATMVGKGPDFPKQPTRKLANGEEVKGLSAVRGRQHDLRSGIEDAKRRVGASNEKTVKDRVMEFNLKDNIDFDKALLQEAEKLGLERELKTAAATKAYHQLSSNRWNLEGLANRLGVRADQVLEQLSGTPRNPFYRHQPFGWNRHGKSFLPGAEAGQDIREILNPRGGRTGARFGDELGEFFFGDDPEELRRKGKKDAENRKR